MSKQALMHTACSPVSTMEVEYPTWVMAVEVSVATTVVFRVQPSLGPWAEASNTGRRRSTRYTSIL